MGWEGSGFISMVDLYIAYRKAKVDMYYERDHVTPSSTSLGSFRPYSFGFRAWRENGLGTIRKALDDGKSVIAVTADLRRFYHEVSPEYLLHPDYLKEFGIQLSADERLFTEQVIEAIQTWAASTPEHRETPYFVIGKLDVPGLRAFQSNFRSPAGGSFKPVPDGFESAPGRGVRPSSK